MKVGVLGSGQLGMMLAEAGHAIDVECLCYGPDPQPCAASACDVIIAGFDDQASIDQFIEQVDVVTVESEHIPLALLEHIEQRKPLYPVSRAVGIAQDRLREKEFLQALQIPLPAYTAVDDVSTLQSLMQTQPQSYMVKTRLQGYDGKGQAILESAEQVEAIFNQLGGGKLVAEEMVKFDREVSTISVRNQKGDICHYLLNENNHRGGILHSSVMLDEPELQRQAEVIAERIMQELDYAGVLCVEYFDVGGRLLVNEIAPRVHNSGHITIEAAVTSQFENHLRAITGMPLGDCSKQANCVMLNIIGTEPERDAIFVESRFFYHTYNKQPRPGRKLGHITLCDESSLRLQESVNRLEVLLCD